MAVLISIPPNLLVLLHLTYLLNPFARPLTNSLHLTRFGASFSSEFQLCPCSFNSDCVSTSGVSMSFTASFALWVPFEGLSGDAVWWFPQCVANPCPFSLFNLCVYVGSLFFLTNYEEFPQLISSYVCTIFLTTNWLFIRQYKNSRRTLCVNINIICKFAVKLCRYCFTILYYNWYNLYKFMQIYSYCQSVACRLE